MVLGAALVVALVIAVVTVLKLRLDRVQQASCATGVVPSEPLVATPEFHANLAVTSLDDAALAERAIARKGLGELEVESGCVIAADPLADPERLAFARIVAPGTYAVILYEARGRIAMAELRFAEGQPQRWVLALLPGQDSRPLKEDEVFGYPVDAGLGSFMDAAGQAALLTKVRRAQNRLGLSYSDAYSDVLKEPLDRAGGTALIYEPLEDDTGTVAVFQSGWGDGVYPSFWGLDALGRPLRLVTDFGVLEKGDGRERDETPDSPEPAHPP